jgi:hypothetical protein
MFLMAKNDSERDDNEAVTLIVDAIIRAKKQPGRHIKDAQGLFIAPGGEPSPSNMYVDNWDDMYESKKKCCKARGRKLEYVGTIVDYLPSSKASDESTKLWRTDPDEMHAYKEECKKFKVKYGRAPTHKDMKKAKIKVPEKVPAKNRVEVRKYALKAGVPDHEIDSIDHRHKWFWQVKDLDSAEDGVKGPKKRPREAAANFGLEVAIVVISALFSGRGLVTGVTAGSYCTWQAQDHPFASLFAEQCGELVSEEQCGSVDGMMLDDPDADVCVWTERPLTVMEAKLGSLAVLHLLMAIFFWCVFTLAEMFYPPQNPPPAVLGVMPLTALTRLYARLQQSDHPALRRSVLLSVP